MGNIRGFSMIELIVVLLILSIMAVFTFPSLQSTIITIDAQEKQFADDIRYAQFLSMTHADVYSVVKTSASSYQILNVFNSPITFATGSTTMNFGTGLTFGTWTNLPNNLVSFDSRGTPYLSSGFSGTPLSAGTTYSIGITDGTNTKTVTITPLTGMVTP